MPEVGPSPTGDRTFGAGAFGVVIAVLALIFASVAVVFDGDDRSLDTPAGNAGGSATVELSEFALAPAALTVPAGGSLDVTNAGSAAHNLTVSGTDIASSDLAAGESETLDLSSLEPGEYEVICAIPGHADAGMKGTLTITDGESGGAASGLSTSGPSDTAAGGRTPATR